VDARADSIQTILMDVRRGINLLSPRIHSILLIKNEEDVVEYCLREASKWSDFIYVYDGASTDRTWEIVNSLRSKQIVPFKQDGQVFREGLRAEVFDAFRVHACEGDWWCQLNGDEFYIDEPRVFLSEVKATRHVVWGAMVQYYLTHQNVRELDFSLPCERVLSELRYYNANCTEPRFFRYRERLTWNRDKAWPDHLGVVEERLIRFKHYPYRSPTQIQMRLNVRRDNRARGFAGWAHASQESWREKLVSSDDLMFDAQDGTFEVAQSVLRQHLGRPHRRFLQSTMHSLGFWP
jgi:glycosyltransferase involved in cell wall biosynthesis